MVKKQDIKNLISRIILLLTCIQAVLGVVWIASNITYVPQFTESQELIQASKNLVLDEYIGILYPLLIKIMSVAGGFFCVPLYVVQLLVAFAAYYHFSKNPVLATYVVTFPPILQCHMSVLPYSLATSMLVFVLAELKNLFSGGTIETKALLKVGIYWILSALLLPDYGIIVGCVVVAAVFMYGWKHRKALLSGIIMLVVSGAFICGVFAFTQSPGSLGKIQKSVGSVMLSRFSWPYFERNYFFWSEDVKALFDMTDMQEISMYPESVIYRFGPQLESAVGKARANELYWEMAIDSFMIGKKDALFDWGQDFVANLCAPISMQLQFDGIGASYTGWNYSRMHANTPELTKYFVEFSLYSFDLLLVLHVVNGLLWRKEEKKGCNIRVLAVLLVGILAIWYTMTGNGMQDYLKVTMISICWCMLPFDGSHNACEMNGTERKLLGV